MRGNITDYVYTYGLFDFNTLPFGPVDALVLAQFSYLKMEGLVGTLLADTDPVTLKVLWEHPLKEQLFTGTFWEQQNRLLFEEMCHSKRYGDMQCIYHEDIVNNEKEYQFSAVTCILNDGSVKIVFRGTDENFAGWKEDMNMAFQHPIPGQQYGLYYLEQVMMLLDRADRLSGMRKRDWKPDLIGHSKGGNLAVYAAMHAKEADRQRIRCIYNLDGPGFRTEVYADGCFEKISDRIVKIIPRSSVVGMILENHGEYRVVDSKSVSVLQHDPFSWMVDRIDFVYVDQMDKGHRIMDENLNAWISSLSEEEVSGVVNTLYRILEASDAADIFTLAKNPAKSMKGMTTAYHNLDKQTKVNLRRLWKSFVKASGDRFKEETGQYLQNKLEDITGRLVGKDSGV